MRAHFDQQLDKLNVELITMGALCEEAIGLVADAISKGQVVKTDIITELEIKVDQKERDIESLCMKLLLQQQPVARDLRVISSALKMISDMERIGDQALDIAETLQYITDTEAESKSHITEMASAAGRMVTDAVAAFVSQDIHQARAVMAYDDKVDALFSQVKEELTALISENPKNGEICLDLLMIAKYFERIGDHAVNIAEWVEFSLTGKHAEVSHASKTDGGHP
ncbi:MAG: phosphate signaling complex protein PhoU [Candidatus Avoscillospira sp.]